MRRKALKSKAGQFEAFKRRLKIMNRPSPVCNAMKLENRCAIWMSSAVWIPALAATLFLTGCETSGNPLAYLSPQYKPENIFLAAPQLPGDLKRVAVLPLACDSRQTDLAAGRDALGSVLVAELIKAKKFEVVPVPPEE